MSLNNAMTNAGASLQGIAAGAGMGAAAPPHSMPRLQLPGGYAAWRPLMETFLRRVGVTEKDYKAPNAQWQAMVQEVARWSAEEEEAAAALVLAHALPHAASHVAPPAEATSSAPLLYSAAVASPGRNTKAGKSTDDAQKEKGAMVAAAAAADKDAELRAARKLVAARVDRSERAFYYLLIAMPESLHPLVRNIPQGYAFGLWEFLEKRFQNTEEDNVADLFRRWNDLGQRDAEPFDAYKARVDEASRLLAYAKEKPSVRQYCYTLLDKLQPQYKQAVLALKAGERLKDVDKIDWEGVVSFINTHERSEQRLQSPGGESSSQGERGMLARNPLARQSESSSSAPSMMRSTRARPESEIQCWRCNEFGHKKWQCPRAKEGGDGGKPPRPKNFKDRAEHKASAKSATSSEDHSSSASHGSAKAAIPMSRNRYDAVQPKEDDREDAASSPTKSCGGSGPAWTRNHSYVAAVVGVTPQQKQRGSSENKMGASLLREEESLDVALATTAWGVDTMASMHCSGNRSLFTSLQRCTPISVELADGSFVTAQHRGAVTLRMRSTSSRAPVSIAINGVYYHERFAANLLGMMRLTQEGWELHATKDGSHLVTPGGNKVKLSTRGNVAVMEAEAEAQRMYKMAGEIVINSVKGVVRLHRRLGHVGFQRLVQICKRGATLDVGKLAVSHADLQRAKQLISECRACRQGKGSRTAFGHKGLDRGQVPFEVLHFDTYEVKVDEPADNEQQKQYGLVASDPRSEWRAFCRCQHKSEIPAEVVAIIRHVQTQTGRKVKRIYCDGGSEFINVLVQGFCRQNGSELHYPPPGTPQLNGVSERHVRSSKDSARTLILEANLPVRFWHFAAIHAANVWNRTRVAAATDITPYEAMYGRPPSMQHVGAFGCDAFRHIPKQQRSSWEPKVQPGVYLGHDWKQNCALVYDLASGRVLVSRDVAYREGKFRFADAVRKGAAAVREIMAADHDEDTELSDDESDGESRSSSDREAHDSSDSGSELDDEPPKDDQPPQEPDHGFASDAGDEHFDVERLTDKRVDGRGRVQYRVKWAGYDDAESTWEPATELRRTARASIDAFERARRRHGNNNQSREPQAESKDQKDDDAGHESELESDGSEPDPLSVSPAVHMVMCALGRDLRATNQPQDELRRRRDMAFAVASGLGLLESRTPSSHAEAMRGPDADKWRAGEQKEWDSCVANDTWELVPRKSLPPGANVIRCKTVYKIKVNEKGEVTEYKARFTPKGFMQRPGVDFFEVFAPTGMYKTMRVGLSLAAGLDYEVDQLDVPSAFLKADLEEDVYMEIPDGFRQGREHLVCKLQKSLYGLKQGPRNWYRDMRSFVTGELGYTATVSDPCLFYRRSRSGKLMLLFVFVDDFQSLYDGNSDSAEWAELKAKLVERYSIKDVGPSRWILGMSITRDRKARTVRLGQELYVTKALEKYGMQGCRPADTPEAVGADLEPGDGDEAVERRAYQEVVGTLLYAAISTRPDIAHAVHRLTRYMQDPKQRHMDAARRVLRYLAGTKSCCLQFGGRRGGDASRSQHGAKGGVFSCVVSAFADADWANNKTNRHSVTGWVAKLNGDTISWASKKQSVVALSTCEAELYAESAAVKEVMWLRGLLKELDLPVREGSVVHGDNESAISLSRNGIKSERTKHVDVQYHFVTEAVERGTIELLWVPTGKMQADIFTKALGRPAFEIHRREIMSCSDSPSEQEPKSEAPSCMARERIAAAIRVSHGLRNRGCDEGAIDARELLLESNWGFTATATPAFHLSPGRRKASRHSEVMFMGLGVDGAGQHCSAPKSRPQYGHYSRSSWMESQLSSSQQKGKKEMQMHVIGHEESPTMQHTSRKHSHKVPVSNSSDFRVQQNRVGSKSSWLPHQVTESGSAIQYQVTGTAQTKGQTAWANGIQSA